MKRTDVILLVALLLLLSGLLAWQQLKTSQKPNYKARVNTVLAKEVVVSLDENGFTPSTVTIKIGTAIRWKNVSGKPQTVNSDNYPTNQLHKELNFGMFNSGSSVMYRFTKPGTYGYHNQIHPEQTGTIIVEKL